MKKLLLLLSFLLISPFAVNVNGFSVIENFSTDWTETDPNSHLTQTATRSTFADMNMNEAANLAKTAGINFTKNWDIAFDFNIASTSQSYTDTVQAQVCLSTTGLALLQFVNLMENSIGTKVQAVLVEFENGGDFTTNGTSDTATLSLDTTYYARFRRDDDVGTNGTLYLDVYASSANRDSGTSVVLSLTHAITTTGKIDMTEAYCPASLSFGNTVQTDGYIENLNLAYEVGVKDFLVNGELQLMGEFKF